MTYKQQQDELAKSKLWIDFVDWFDLRHPMPLGTDRWDAINALWRVYKAGYVIGLRRTHSEMPQVVFNPPKGG